MALSACVLPRRSYRKNVRTRVLRANPPTTLPARVRRRHAYRERRPSPHSPRGPSDSFTRVRTSSARLSRTPSFPAFSAWLLRQLHPRAYFVGTLTRNAAHLRANFPAASFTCAMRVLRRRVYRKRRLPPRLPRKPSGGFTKVRSRSPQVRFAAALIGSAVWRISRYSSFASPA